MPLALQVILLTLIQILNSNTSLNFIVENGKYTPPDSFLDLTLAAQLTVQYINLYLAANLEEKKADM